MLLENTNNDQKYYTDSQISKEELEELKKKQKKVQTESTDPEDKPKIQYFTE